MAFYTDEDKVQSVKRQGEGHYLGSGASGQFSLCLDGQLKPRIWQKLPV